MGKYDGIINMPRHISAKRRHMSRGDRAKLFSPFAALKGYEEAVKVKERLVTLRKQPGEEQLKILNEKINILCENRGSEAEVTCFSEDEYIGGGAGEYITVSGKVSKVDKVFRFIVIGERKIPLDDIIDINLKKDG